MSEDSVSSEVPANLSLIVAVASNGVIGRDGELPFRLSADLRRFKRLTMDHHIIMGRRTLESIGRLLPGRTTVVVTRQLDFQWPGAVVVHSRRQALQAVAGDDEPFVVGGRLIYDLFLPIVERVYLTRVIADVAGDTHFPALDEQRWSREESEIHPSDERNEFDHAFETWRRRRADGSR